VLEQIRQDAQRMKFLGINNKQVMLTTWGDPYCREESNLNLTTEVLKILLENEIPTAILTKGGTRCLKDLELFKQFGEGIKVGASFSFTNDVHSKHFEPTAALPQDRLDAMEKLNKAGIRTWASEEPVIDVTQSLEIIDITQSYVDEFKFGKLSGDTVEALVDGKFKFNLKPDYKLFLNEAVKKMREYGNDFYVKKDLLKCDPTIKLKPCEIDQDHLTLKKFK
jgi:DNA repair photolyase